MRMSATCCLLGMPSSSLRLRPQILGHDVEPASSQCVGRPAPAATPGSVPRRPYGRHLEGDSDGLFFVSSGFWSCASPANICK